jgi:hypothetical protein
MSYVVKPSPCFIDSFEFYKVIGGRKVYRNNDFYYSWDELHGEIEVFDKRGYHLGALHATSGEKIKRAVKGRRLNVQ